MFTKSFLSNLLILLFVSQLFITTGFSQSTSYLDSLDGKFALQFQIDRNFTLTNFQGTTLSGKYHFSCRDAVRLGLSLELGDSEIDATTNQFDSINVATINATQTSLGVTLKTQYLRYFRGSNDISFFGGVGPFFTYYKSTNEGKTLGTPDDRNFTETSDRFTFGLDLIAGIEWFFYNNMSLSAEYGLNFSYNSNTREYNDDIVSRKTEDTVYRITGNNINFGITVYF
jgi:opacity protein-like surface antigen